MAVLHYINKLKQSHSCGHDNISSNVLKIIAIEVSPCLTLISNQVNSAVTFRIMAATFNILQSHFEL